MLGARRLEAEQRGECTFVDSCSSQISGRTTMKNARTGPETASAVRSGWPSAIPFGTSSPITTCRYVTISSARITARNDAITALERCASTCSPRAPIASEEIVTPSCIAEMNRGGSP